MHTLNEICQLFKCLLCYEHNSLPLGPMLPITFGAELTNVPDVNWHRGFVLKIRIFCSVSVSLEMQLFKFPNVSDEKTLKFDWCNQLKRLS